MKVGVLAQYLNTRNDVKYFINHLSSSCDVIVFLRKTDMDIASGFADTVEVRSFTSTINKYRLYLIDKIFKLFGILPVSKNNYYITEEFKLQNSAYSKFYFRLEKLTLFLSRLTPKFISYKRYLRLLSNRSQAKLADIDIFFCITQIYDDPFYSCIQETTRPVINYVYSWDHPCKMKCFINDARNYYGVWSEEIGNDVRELQNIERNKIFILGATQFIYLFNYKKKAGALNKRSGPPVIYFAFATGIPALIAEEIIILRHIIMICTEEVEDIIFRIRPYPFVKDWNIYNDLMNLKNVILEEDFRLGDTLSVSEEEYGKKYAFIGASAAFIHFGTTLALEAANLGVPVILCDMAVTYKMKNLDRFVHQYQNDRYINLGEFPDNVCKTPVELLTSIRNILNGTFRNEYNDRLQNVALPEDVNVLGERLIAFLKHKAG